MRGELLLAVRMKNYYNSRMTIKWNEVTWYSKILAVIIFGATFVFGLRIGMEYQHALDEPQLLSVTPFAHRTKVRPVLDATGQHCGGFIRNAPICPVNYHCELGRIPDAGGVCVHDAK